MRIETIFRHTLVVRVTHWINAGAMLLLLMSGLQIFNAHPALYWGQVSSFGSPWLNIDSAPQRGDKAAGYIAVAGHRFGTTGLLGLSTRNGEVQARAFPAWSTLPGDPDLATGRRWHFLVAWIFAVNIAVYIISGVLSGHLRGDLLPSASELKPQAIGSDIMSHIRLQFPEGDHARHYNVLQKLSYLGVFFVALPLVVLSGCTMSPALDAFAPWLVEVFGGRQSARSCHFLLANLLVLFVVIHLAMVLLSGVWNNCRSMITGNYTLRFKASDRAK